MALTYRCISRYVRTEGVAKAGEGLLKVASRIKRSNILPSPLPLPTVDFPDMQAFVDLPGILWTIFIKVDSSNLAGHSIWAGHGL